MEDWALEATSATLSHPLQIAVDSNSNIYIADTGNNVVRRVVSGIINTVAGTGTAGFGGDGGSATLALLNLPASLPLILLLRAYKIFYH